MIGLVLDGRYCVVSLIGRGGMGNVYLAEETRLKRRCALKILHPHLTADRGHVDRFLREAQTIAQLEHINIVDVISCGEEPTGVVFFAMELLNGEDLERRMKAREERPYTLHESCLWAIQIARAVAAVHDAGLIHRDLKVSNIFLALRRDGEEIVKLLDFGIARPEAGSEMTATGMALGTPSYMSPEQIENRGVDRRTDIYSFGILLYKLATGRLPFIGDPIQVAVQHRDVQPLPPSEMSPDVGISPALEHVILTAMEKRPDQRFQSMQEVEAALLAVIMAEAPYLLDRIVKTSRSATMSLPFITRANLSSPSLTPMSSTALPAEQTPNPGMQRTGTTSTMDATPVRRSYRNLYLILFTSALTLASLVFYAVTRGDREAAPTEDTTTPPIAAVVPATSPVTAPTPDPDPPTKSEPTPTKSEPVKSTPTVTKPRPADPPSSRSSSPVAKILAKAVKCRRKHKAVGGPKIAVTYWVATDGIVRDAKPSIPGALGNCLAAAVSTTKFEAKLALNKKLDL